LFDFLQIPDPSTIRPEHILKQSFAMLKEKWREKQDWLYVCEQFKSIRQDLTVLFSLIWNNFQIRFLSIICYSLEINSYDWFVVKVQGIRNEFTVEVYETHARLCLENVHFCFCCWTIPFNYNISLMRKWLSIYFIQKDIHEFNQCQSQLRHLYELGIQGNVLEFAAYRILYLLWEQNEIGLSRYCLMSCRDVNNTECWILEMTEVLKELPKSVRQHNWIKHALKVRTHHSNIEMMWCPIQIQFIHWCWQQTSIGSRSNLVEWLSCIF
jgi:hypothetical protein